MRPKRIVMASGNAGKLRELSRLLQPLGIDVIAQSEFGFEEADETANTFAGNSLIKAEHAMQQTGLPAIADDSGLSVDALNGAPGVLSARYAGVGASDEDNIEKLLDAMSGFDGESRKAAFHCVATFVLPAGTSPTDSTIVTEGRWPGELLKVRRGKGGFGYDPIFLDAESGQSAAELTAEQKNARSHRGQALRALVKELQKRFQ